MGTDIVEKTSEYVPLFDHKILRQKYEKLLQEHESLKKRVELLKNTFGFTLELVNKNEQELLPNDVIKEWESNIDEMQKRISRDEEKVFKNNDSLPEVHSKASKKRRSKKREKKIEDSFCDEKLVDDAEKITPQDSADMTFFQEEKRNLKRDRNCNSADVTVEEEMSIDITKTQSPKAKRRKKRKTKTMDVDQPLHVNDAENCGGEGEMCVASVMVDLKSKEDKEELRENTYVKLSEDVVQTQIPKAKRRKKKKTKAMEVCDPLGGVHVVETTKKEKENPLESEVVETTEKEKEDPLGIVLAVETIKKEKGDKTGEF